MLKFTQPGFKVTIFVNPNPVFFVYVCLPDGEVATGGGDSWEEVKEREPTYLGAFLTWEGRGAGSPGRSDSAPSPPGP